jgi:hypothetical protein
MTPRRDPAKTSDAKITGTTLKGKKRDRSWDAEHNYQVAGYRIPLELKQAIKDLAVKLGVSPAEVARAFFEYGLEAHQRGDIDLTPAPKGKTLFPGE